MRKLFILTILALLLSSCITVERPQVKAINQLNEIADYVSQKSMGIKRPSPCDRRTLLSILN